MKVLLIKPETIGIFAFTKQVDHEPLEMEYLYTVLSDMGHESIIYDRRHEYMSIRKKLKLENPDIVCITGYITQEPLMKQLTKHIKRYNPSINIRNEGMRTALA